VQVQFEGKYPWKMKLEDIYISVMKICSFYLENCKLCVKEKEWGRKNNKFEQKPLKEETSWEI